MKVFIHLTGHTNTGSLPLRMGIHLVNKHQQFAELINSAFDQIGTNSQRHDEIEDKQHKHYTGILSIPHEDSTVNNPYQKECRVVLSMPSSNERSPFVVTVLRLDNNMGDMTVTKHLGRLLKKNRITVDDVINYFHPAYLRGEIQDSTDCDDIFHKYVAKPISEVISTDSATQAILANPAPIIKVMDSIEVDDLDLMAPAIFKNLEIANVRYKYSLVDCYLEDVWMENDLIRLCVIGSNGEKHELHSFKPRDHLLMHHEYTFNYLKNRKQQRAVFAVCTSAPCKGFLAESVTSIALQLMRTKGLSLRG